MGFLRLLFALSIVVVHTHPFLKLETIAPFALNSFFVISGFYMAFILSEKYIGMKGSYKLFLSNRFLRLYPMYWIILLLTFALTLVKYFMIPTQDNYITHLLSYLAQSSFAGWEILLTVLRNIFLIQPIDYFRTNFLDPGYLMIQPAWSLQVEFFFYLFAPLLVRIKTPFLLLITFIFAFVSFGPPHAFLQTNLSISYLILDRFVFFLFGMLSYKLYAHIHPKVSSKKLPKIIFASFLLVLSIFCTLFPESSSLRLFYYLVLVIALAFIFMLTKKIKFDMTIGLLSYPVYLSHQLIYKVLMSTPLATGNPQLQTLMTIVVTIGFSWLLVFFIEKPINAYRQKRLVHH